MSGVERRDAEITELELQLSTLLEDIENLSKKVIHFNFFKKCMYMKISSSFLSYFSGCGVISFHDQNNHQIIEPLINV